MEHFGAPTGPQHVARLEDLPSAASEIDVTPDGEMSATDVQAALVDLYGRTALDRALDDAYAAVTIVEQFPDVGGASAGRHGVHGWNVQVNGTGADVLQATVTPAPALAAFIGGGRFLVTGTTTSGRAALNLQGLAHVSSAAVPSPFWMEWYAGIPVLADGTDSFRAILGLVASVTAPPSGTGVWFEHVNGQANWRLKADTEDIDTGVPVTAATMHRFRLVSDGGGSIYGYIDGTEVGQLAQADLSSGVAGQPGMGVFKTAGTANRWLAVQRYLARIEVAPQMVW